MASKDWPDLVDPSELIGFPGAPFPANTTNAASAQIRRICGWHIAPVITETMVLDHDGSGVLHLPSLMVLDIVSVRSLAGPVPRDLSGWRWSGAGMVEGSFPRGFRSVEVVVEHGFESCPDDLLPVVASRTQRRAMQESLGSRSVSYSADGDRAVESTLDSYMLGPRP